jgi:hypothetical protein
VRERLGIVKPSTEGPRKAAEFFTDTPFEV